MTIDNPKTAQTVEYRCPNCKWVGFARLIDGYCPECREYIVYALPAAPVTGPTTEHTATPWAWPKLYATPMCDPVRGNAEREHAPALRLSDTGREITIFTLSGHHIGSEPSPLDWANELRRRYEAHDALVKALEWASGIIETHREHIEKSHSGSLALHDERSNTALRLANGEG